MEGGQGRGPTELSLTGRKTPAEVAISRPYSIWYFTDLAGHFCTTAKWAKRGKWFARPCTRAPQIHQKPPKGRDIAAQRRGPAATWPRYGCPLIDNPGIDNHLAFSFRVTPESIVVPIVSCIFGFPLLALTVICCLRRRAKLARERARRRNCELERGKLSVVRVSPARRARAVSLVRSPRALPALELDTVLEERSDPEQTTLSQVIYSTYGRSILIHTMNYFIFHFQ
ncbi:hypothetical protein EVAR_40272_1 [Eumeta japonica]|uniref:Uncharacterized protein n=1 Tax=Eumeta variegata TaxID=151549 RepID=A0A4C1WZH1_EUMVA|nr:hypothetical protein EVAR_40272_1 [Eumeta japonica]